MTVVMTVIHAAAVSAGSVDSGISANGTENRKVGGSTRVSHEHSLTPPMSLRHETGVSREGATVGVVGEDMEARTWRLGVGSMTVMWPLWWPLWGAGVMGGVGGL